jgi:hypothetical protein
MKVSTFSQLVYQRACLLYVRIQFFTIQKGAIHSCQPPGSIFFPGTEPFPGVKLPERAPQWNSELLLSNFSLAMAMMSRLL